MHLCSRTFLAFGIPGLGDFLLVLRRPIETTGQIRIYQGFGNIIRRFYGTSLGYGRKWVRSSAIAAGSSTGEKCPPRGKTVQRRML